MGTATSASFLEAPGSEPRTLAALLLESIALRHQIAVLERSRTRRPCFRLWDRLFWILFSRWWPQWRDSLIIVHSETVLRWRRDGGSALWRYRARGRWRGGRLRISSVVRHLIVGWPAELLWCAPRIHGELLMLGFSVSQHEAGIQPLETDQLRQRHQLPFGGAPLLPERRPAFFIAHCTPAHSCGASPCEVV
jgi:hypothetical protein